MSAEIEKKEEAKVEQPKAPEKKEEPKAKTADELKAEAEALEAEIEAHKAGKKDEEIAANQARRVEKAKAKLAKLKGGSLEGEEEEAPAPKTGETDVRDLITLGKHDIAEDSPKAKILSKYKAGGLIKSFAEGLTHAGVKAEFATLDEANKAKSVIDENDTDDVKLKTKKEIVDGYKASGEVPADPKSRKAIADANLAEMGL